MGLIDTYAIPMYKGFQLMFSEDMRTMDLRCRAYKHPYYLKAIDDHGVLRRNLNDAEIVEFTISHSEFFATDETRSEVIMRRFTAEVDYYLKQSMVIPKDPNKDSFLRRYRCNHCGTDAILGNPGYTPTCPNCGALMRMEE